MLRDPFDSAGNFVFLGVMIALIIVMAILVSWVALITVPMYIGYRLWKDSPARLERVAREETMVLYNHALSGSVHLSDADIDKALTRHWPADLPPTLGIQLLDVGKAIFEQEGLLPDVPPPPALCNTVEGARYRDMLARAGQADGRAREELRDALRPAVVRVRAQELPVHRALQRRGRSGDRAEVDPRAGVAGDER